mmetsp:Transcript_625/g.2243  ORF Transcript_625/g.2243 Transcript_625/m.2243 type:complete len:253 (+) Transcript_625:1478-2236(+)
MPRRLFRRLELRRRVRHDGALRRAPARGGGLAPGRGGRGAAHAPPRRGGGGEEARGRGGRCPARPRRPPRPPRLRPQRRERLCIPPRPGPRAAPPPPSCHKRAARRHRRWQPSSPHPRELPHVILLRGRRESDGVGGVPRAERLRFADECHDPPVRGGGEHAQGALPELVVRCERHVEAGLPHGAPVVVDARDLVVPLREVRQSDGCGPDAVVAAAGVRHELDALVRVPAPELRAAPHHHEPLAAGDAQRRR